MKDKYKKYSERDINRFFKKKKVTAVLFIIILLYFFISNFSPINNEEKAINIYGFIQNFLGKKEVGGFEVLKDDKGFLHLTSFLEEGNDVNHIVKNTVNLKENIKNNRTKFIYLMPPHKVIEGFNKFERGLPRDFQNETADKFLKSLDETSIEYIDFRDAISKGTIPKEEVFYKTDHHWKIETAFYAYTYLVDELNLRYKENLDSSGMLRDLENYNMIKYEESYLGSLGRKTGKYYGGVDDFTLIYPKFKTSFDLYLKSNEVEINTTGRFEEVLLSMETLRNEDLFSLYGDKYSVYLFGNQGFLHIKNNLKSDGLKVLFIKDSFAVPLAAFFSNTVSDVYMVDQRYYKEDMIELMNSLIELDYVFLSISPQNLSKEFFRF